MKNTSTGETYTKEMIALPEEMLVMVANQFGQSNNNFRKYLDIGTALKIAGLHPLFMSTPDFKEIIVTTYEKLNNKLH